MVNKSIKTLVLLTSIIPISIGANSLIVAISSSDSKQVKNLLEDHDLLDAHYKKILLHAAQEAAVMAKHNLKLSRSKRDQAALLTGSGVVLSCIPLAMTGHAEDKCAAIGLLPLGFACIYRGARCTSAHAQDKAAQEILELIEQKSMRDINKP